MTEQKTKFDFLDERWQKELACYQEAKIYGKDTQTGKKVSGHWPHDKSQLELKYRAWLAKVQDPDTGEWYKQRDKDGNVIKGTGPKYLVKQIVRIRTNDDKEFLYSNGFLLAYNVMGDPVSLSVSDVGAWTKTGFAYKKEYDQEQGRVKSKILGPNQVTTEYEIPFNEKNLKELFDKRITPEDLKLMGQKRVLNLTFAVKDERNGVVKECKDATGILHKTMDLFLKPFDYLYNADYISPQQKEQARRDAIDMGLLPREAQGQQTPASAPPKGTYG